MGTLAPPHAPAGPGPRFGLGCMRLSTEDDRDEQRGAATIAAALEAGVTIFDTAHAYARDDTELGHNERLLARTLREHGAIGVHIVTKGGMRRPQGRWETDGRARSLREDCEASVAALGGYAIDTYLLHAPDPRVPWATSVRALAELERAGLVRRVGLSNVTRRQLDEAIAMAQVAVVEVALGPFSDVALRGGVVARCIELGIEVLAHSPLGGPARAARVSGDADVQGIAVRHGVTAQRVILSAIADLHPSIVPVVGARRPETVLASAAPLTLDDEDRACLERRYGWRAILSPPAVTAPSGAEVLLLMGVQGAGKSSATAAFVERGYVRLNRDERGGTLPALHRAMDELLASGARQVVADNTYTTRAQRQAAIEVARRHGARVSGVWIEVSLADAQRNVVERMLERHGRLLDAEEIRRAKDPSALGPMVLGKTLQALEPPQADEGFAALQTITFVRRPRAGRDREATFVALEAAEQGFRPDAALALVFGWSPGATDEWLAEKVRAFGVPVRCCPHEGGPPRCWCRPPLPGLLLEFAHRHGVDLARSTLVGTKPLHAAMARALGVAYRDAE